MPIAVNHAEFLYIFFPTTNPSSPLQSYVSGQQRGQNDNHKEILFSEKCGSRDVATGIKGKRRGRGGRWSASFRDEMTEWRLKTGEQEEEVEADKEEEGTDR